MFAIGKKVFLLILIGLFVTACGGRGEGGSVKIDNSPEKSEKKAPRVILID